MYLNTEVVPVHSLKKRSGPNKIIKGPHISLRPSVRGLLRKCYHVEAINAREDDQ